MNNILSYMIPYLFCVILPKLTESYGISVTCFCCCARFSCLAGTSLAPTDPEIQGYRCLVSGTEA